MVVRARFISVTEARKNLYGIMDAVSGGATYILTNAKKNQSVIVMDGKEYEKLSLLREIYRNPGFLLKLAESKKELEG